MVRAYTPGQLPAQLRDRDFQVLRTADAGEVYAYPRAEVARLAKHGGLHRLATGYYAITPAELVGRRWLPELESAALGIAVADYGIEQVALMGLSAARVHGGLPRAIGVAVVAIPKQRPVLALADRDADVHFVKRTIARLDVQRFDTELGAGLVTGIEQTVLDLAARPDLGGMRQDAEQAMTALLARADHDLLDELAGQQRKRATLRRVLGGHDAQ